MGERYTEARIPPRGRHGLGKRPRHGAGRRRLARPHLAPALAHQRGNGRGLHDQGACRDDSARDRVRRTDRIRRDEARRNAAQAAGCDAAGGAGVEGGEGVEGRAAGCVRVVLRALQPLI